MIATGFRWRALRFGHADQFRGICRDAYLYGCDACPVKAEVIRVARRHDVKVYVVANSPLRMPVEDLIELVVVKNGFDAADDWIAERIALGDIAITADIPLADRCLKRGARVLGYKGVEFTEEAIGNALATRAIPGHVATIGRVWWRPGSVRQCGPLAVPGEARRADPRGPPRPAKPERRT